jgi:hypothetical protein
LKLKDLSALPPDLSSHALYFAPDEVDVRHRSPLFRPRPNPALGALTGRRSRESLPADRRGESDMASAAQKIKLSPSRDIPFNKLVLSQSNVRRVKAGV